VNYIRLSKSVHSSQLPYNATDICQIKQTQRTLCHDEVCVI